MTVTYIQHVHTAAKVTICSHTLFYGLKKLGGWVNTKNCHYQSGKQTNKHLNQSWKNSSDNCNRWGLSSGCSLSGGAVYYMVGTTMQWHCIAFCLFCTEMHPMIIALTFNVHR